MTKMSVTLADPEEVHTVDVDARDRRAFERYGFKDLGRAPGDLRTLAQSMPESYGYWLAWNAYRRGGGTIPWPDWEARAVELTSDTDPEDMPDPTKPGRTPG